MSQFKQLEGNLKKKNSKGQWKDRLCTLSDDTFSAYKTAKRGLPAEIKECFDVKLLESCTCDADIMEMKLINGETMLFKGSNIVTRGTNTELNETLQVTSNVNEWRRAILNRMEWALKKLGSTISNNEKIHISGKLLKKSHNKYQLSMQERFVKVQGTSLYYYKREGEEKESGVVSLSSADFIRPYDRSADCKIFEIFCDGRLYSFQSETPSEMKRWLDVLIAIRDGSRDLAEAEESARILAETPPRIRIFDNEGVNAFREIITKEINAIYAASTENDVVKTDIKFWSLRKHLDVAKAINRYVEDFLPEIRASVESQLVQLKHRGPRYDILAIFLIVVNNILSENMMSILSPTSRQVVAASLGDLHSTIDWLTKYQQTMKRCHCPSAAISSVNDYIQPVQPPNHCRLFEALSGLCNRYVNGSEGSNGDDGAASHLIDHCMKVWNTLVGNPSDMLQRHLDGSFYTAAPTAMWEALHQHLQLATSTQSPVLHVLIADKIAAALMHITCVIENYVQTVDFNRVVHGAELKEIELELLCALANDNALHLEEMIAMVESFEFDEIRARIDELFDPVTIALVKCGQTCLRRLSSVLYLDVEQKIDQVFTDEWLEGNQLQVVTATLTDYMNDLQQYLMPFWTEKFIYILLEHVILRYAKAVIISADEDNAIVQATPEPTSKPSFFRGLGSKMKSLTSVMTVMTDKQSSKIFHCRANPESLGRLAQDVNILNHFFSQRAGQEIATEFLGLINEVSVMLFQSVDELQIHVLSQIAVYPASAEAIFDMAMHCLRMRDDVTKEDIEEFRAALRPALVAAPTAAEENNALGVAEGRLGLLYADLMALCSAVKMEKASSRSATEGSLAQKLKDMANIPLAALKKAIVDEQEENEMKEESSSASESAVNVEEVPVHISEETSSMLLKRRQSLLTKTTAGLVDDVLDVLQQQNDELSEQLAEQDRLRQQFEAIRMKSPGVVNLEGHLDKKSPAHNLWQSRWFKILTKENPAAVDTTDDSIAPYLYQLLWYKKKGGSVIKCIDCSQIVQLHVSLCNRPLVWQYNTRKLRLESEVDIRNLDVVSVAVGAFKGDVNSDSIAPTSACSYSSTFMYVFVVEEESGKQHVLCASKVDKMVAWMNTLASVSRLNYDSTKGCWMAEKLVSPPTKMGLPSNESPSIIPDGKYGSPSDSFSANSDSAVSSTLPQISQSDNLALNQTSFAASKGRNLVDNLEPRQRLSQKISTDGSIVTGNPLRRNDVVEGESVPTQYADVKISDEDAEQENIMEEDIPTSSQQYSIRDEKSAIYLSQGRNSAAKTPRRLKSSTPRPKEATNTGDEENEDSDTIVDKSSTISPSSRSLFRKRLLKQTTIDTDLVNESFSDVKPAKLSPKSAGLSLFNPTELQHNRVKEAEEEWNKYYSDDGTHEHDDTASVSSCHSTRSANGKKHVSFDERPNVVTLLMEDSSRSIASTFFDEREEVEAEADEDPANITSMAMSEDVNNEEDVPMEARPGSYSPPPNSHRSHEVKGQPDAEGDNKCLVS